MPNGSPSESKEYGMLMAGTPAVVQGDWNTGSPVVSVFGAPDIAVGVKIISHTSNIFESFSEYCF